MADARTTVLTSVADAFCVYTPDPITKAMTGQWQIYSPTAGYIGQAVSTSEADAWTSAAAAV